MTLPKPVISMLQLRMIRTSLAEVIRERIKQGNSLFQVVRFFPHIYIFLIIHTMTEHIVISVLRLGNTHLRLHDKRGIYIY